MRQCLVSLAPLIYHRPSCFFFLNLQRKTGQESPHGWDQALLHHVGRAPYISTVAQKLLRIMYIGLLFLCCIETVLMLL
ncbi:hypothetical protein BD408DRAFT_425591 [Parasitella parasitica]|nr:hypothetical protein BD408DRAFT_425591 [Parasitella parasitica]